MIVPSGQELLLIAAILVLIVPFVMFLLSQNAFAKSMRTNIDAKNTASFWIWTQLIPIWSLIAIPITLSKLNEQFNYYVIENNLISNPNLKYYSSSWGWVWFIGTILGILVPFLFIVALVGSIGFWIHIVRVRKNLEIISMQK